MPLSCVASSCLEQAHFHAPLSSIVLSLIVIIIPSAVITLTSIATISFITRSLPLVIIIIHHLHLLILVIIIIIREARPDGDIVELDLPS